jgi:hypothetical protein
VVEHACCRPTAACEAAISFGHTGGYTSGCLYYVEAADDQILPVYARCEHGRPISLLPNEPIIFLSKTSTRTLLDPPFLEALMEDR